MMQPPNPFAGIHKVFFVLIIIGAFAVLGLINSDLVNPITSLAKAGRYVQETDQITKTNQVEANAQITKQNEINAIDTEKYKEIKDAETKAQIAKIEADQAAYAKLQEQQLQDQARQAALESEKSRQQATLEFEKAQRQNELEFERSRLVQYGTISILVICFSVVMIRFQRNRLILAPEQVQMKRIDAWQDPALRKQQIESARQRERAMRELELRQAQTIVVPAFYPEEAPILWEDIRQQFAEARKNRKAN